MTKIFITCKESKIESNHSFYGSFYIGPFNEAQSLTVANALRRSLLSDCVGLGMTSVIIENVSHEYSTLPGVRDSILDILLNLKEIVFKKKQNLWQIYKKKGFFSIYEELGSLYLNPFVGYLKIRGPGIIRAKDLCLPPFIQCVDPNQYIATLAHDGYLNMKFVITEGKGYKVQKSNKDLDFGLVKKRQELLNDLIEIQPLLHKSSLTLGGPSPHANHATSVQAPKALVAQELRQRRLALHNHSGDAKESTILPKDTVREQSSLITPLGITTQGSSLENINKKKIISNFPKLAVFNKKHPFFGENLNKKENIGSLKSATQLFLDTVFNPITKVNYVIEAIESKNITNDHQKALLVEDLTSFLETSNLYQTNFPSLKKRKNLKHAVFSKTKVSDRLFIHRSSTFGFGAFAPLGEKGQRFGGKGVGGFAPLKPRTTSTVGALSGHKPTLEKGNKTTQQKQHKKIIEIMNKYLDFELNLFSKSLHPLKNNESFHNIILEIWTNGSLHPRDALSLAFQNLSFLFLNMQKTKIYNPFFYQASSYDEYKKKLLTK